MFASLRLRLLGCFFSESRSQLGWATSPLAEFSEDQPSRRCVGSSSLGTLAPFPAIGGKEPQGAPGSCCRSYEIKLQLSGSCARGPLRRGFCPTSSLEPLPHCRGFSAVWNDMGRICFPAFSFDRDSVH